MGTLTAEQQRDLTDPLYYGAHDPEPILRILREEEPVHWTMGHIERGFWSVANHADARFVYGNDRGEDALLSSRRWGTMLPIGLDWENPVEGDLMWLFQAGGQLSSFDGDRHTKTRGFFTKSFTPAAVAKYEGLIRSISIDAINSVIERGECDFAADVAGVLPLTLISHIMDVPREDWAKLYNWTYMSTAPADPEFSIGTPEETSFAGIRAITEYCRQLALKRRENPGDDLVSILATAKVDGEYLADVELGFNGSGLYSAGHETTRNALCGALEELLGNDRAEWERLRSHRHDKSVMQKAADEMVRWSTPLTHQLRTATRDFELGGKKIKADDWVVVWNNSANRDAAVFENPYSFNGSRGPNPHLGFAYGAHFCLGAHLAKLELRIMLELLLEHLPDLTLAGGSEVAASLLFRGVKRQPVTFKPKAPIPK
jgi:cytochrome P450